MKYTQEDVTVNWVLELCISGWSWPRNINVVENWLPQSCSKIVLMYDHKSHNGLVHFKVLIQFTNIADSVWTEYIFNTIQFECAQWHEETSKCDVHSINGPWACTFFFSFFSFFFFFFTRLTFCSDTFHINTNSFKIPLKFHNRD